MKSLALALSLAVVAFFSAPSARACPGSEGAKSCGSCAHKAGSGGEAHGAEGKACSGDPKTCAEKGCPHAKEGKSCHGGMASTGVKEVTVAEAVAFGSKAKFFDANGAETRAKQGVIPGAMLLTSSSGYDVAKELPAAKDAKLVFYCAGPKCKASHAAAKRASEAGFADVNVLPDGISGWKTAGQPTSNVPQS